MNKENPSSTCPDEVESEKVFKWIECGPERLKTAIKWFQMRHHATGTIKTRDLSCMIQETVHGFQKPSVLLYPQLTSKPFWDSNQFDWIHELLELNVPIFKQEYLQLISKNHNEGIMNQMDEIHTSNVGGKWRAFYFYKEGQKVSHHFNLCPKTSDIIEKIPLLMRNNGMAYVYFSVISPGTHILAHYGVSNAKLRIQLPIIVPSLSLSLPSSSSSLPFKSVVVQQSTPINSTEPATTDLKTEAAETTATETTTTTITTMIKVPKVDDSGESDSSNGCEMNKEKKDSLAEGSGDFGQKNEQDNVDDCCYIKVGNEKRVYQESQCLVFDDSFAHEVVFKKEINGKSILGDRVVLLIDIWHPELTEIEKKVAEHFLK